MIYLDYNATTPVDERVLHKMTPYFTEKFGNAGSKTHAWGWIAEEAVEKARNQIATAIHCLPEEIIFTSGATESINLALIGVYETYKSKGRHMVTLPTEHKATLDTYRFLEKQGAEITYLTVDREGLVDKNLLTKTLREDTILISCIYGNNETGTIQDISTIGRIAHERGIIFMSDATHAAGKIDIDVNHDQTDLLALSAHKIYGPKGIGALYVRRRSPRVNLQPLIHGGGHEKGLRSGTLNVPAIVGFGEAMELAISDMWSDNIRISAQRTRLEQALTETGKVFINGSIKHRTCNTTNLYFDGIRSTDLIKNLPDIAFSTGSACTSASQEPSHVLKAMGLSTEACYSSIRFSLGRFTKAEEVNTVLEKVIGLLG